MQNIIELLNKKQAELNNYVSQTNTNVALLYMGCSDEKKIPAVQVGGWQPKEPYFDYYNMAVGEIDTLERLKYASHAVVGVTYIQEVMYYFIAIRRKYNWMIPEMQNADHLYYNDPIKLFTQAKEIVAYMMSDTWWSAKVFGEAELRDYINFAINQTMKTMPTKAPAIKAEIKNGVLSINSLHTLATNMVG